MSRVKDFLKRSIVPFLVFAYFVRFAYPQGFHGFTIYLVVGGLIGVGIWGIVGLVRSRVQNAPASPRHKSFLMLSVFGLGLFGLSLVGRYAYDHKKFDSALWKDAKTSMSFDSNLLTPRQLMLNDLVENVLPGLTKDEVISLLGDPEEKLQPDENEASLLYVLGPERGFGVDFECLSIYFDKTGYFQSYKTFGNCG